jgi:predicted choloylglycine hydrolase
MRKCFVAIREDVPGSDWLARFIAGRAEAEAWYLNGRAPAPSAAECAAQIRRYMPEFAQVTIGLPTGDTRYVWDG